MSTLTTPRITDLVGDDRESMVGTWKIDPAHSSIEATARHMVVSKVRGRFRSFSARVEIGPELEDCEVSATIDAASVDTNEPSRDEHLRSADFLDVEAYPQMTFSSQKILQVGERGFELIGELTICGIPNIVVIDCEFLGMRTDPFGETRILCHATTELDRERWGMTWNQALETGGVLVGSTLQVEMDIQLVRGET